MRASEAGQQAPISALIAFFETRECPNEEGGWLAGFIGRPKLHSAATKNHFNCLIGMSAGDGTI
jgi:hypothetical protein